MVSDTRVRPIPVSVDPELGRSLYTLCLIWYGVLIGVDLCSLDPTNRWLRTVRMDPDEGSPDGGHTHVPRGCRSPLGARLSVHDPELLVFQNTFVYYSTVPHPLLPLVVIDDTGDPRGVHKGSLNLSYHSLPRRLCPSLSSKNVGSTWDRSSLKDFVTLVTERK